MVALREELRGLTRLIRFTTVLAVATVAVVAAILSYRHLYALAETHGDVPREQ